MGTEKRSAGWVVAVVGVVVAAVVGGVLLSREYGGPSYQGKRTAEWRRLADDADEGTRAAAYRALAVVDPGELAARFDSERITGLRLIAARTAVENPANTEKVARYVEDLMGDEFGDLYLDNPDLHAVLTVLKVRNRTGPIEPKIRKWTTTGYRTDEAQALLKRIE